MTASFPLFPPVRIVVCRDAQGTRAPRLPDTGFVRIVAVLLRLLDHAAKHARGYFAKCLETLFFLLSAHGTHHAAKERQVAVPVRQEFVHE